MNDGKRKTLLARTMATINKDCGIAFLCSGHTGEKIDMSGSPMSHPKKEMQFMNLVKFLKV